VIRFGDGARGARPPAGAILRVAYDYGAGAAGNVGAGAITQASVLPPGMKVANPVPTWGGAEAESVAEGEKQAARYLQHRDRLVSVADFESIVRRTPGVELGRVDVLPAFDPDLQPSEPGDAAGCVTVMVVPRLDPAHPDTPEPDAAFLDAICSYLDPRRLVTTEVFLRGPTYRGIWVSVGVDVVAGESEAVVRERVRAELLRFLAPVDPTLPPWYEDVPVSIDAPYVHEERGWPLGKAVVALELQAVASRVPGVRYVRPVQIAEGTSATADAIEFQGLDLPRVLGLSVSVGDPARLDDVRGVAPAAQPAQTVVPVPVVPETC
jgi:predicted phage baseplate assembly protein